MTITPPAPTLLVTTLLVKSTQQFTANVEGSDDNSATFAIEEKSQGGSIAQTTKTTANYTAPGVAGVYHVVATSVADPNKIATATVNVVTKSKDSKGHQG